MIDFGYGVYLCPVNSTDTEIIREWRNDERVWKWCRQHDLISDKMQTRWFESQDNDSSMHMYVVMDQKGKVGVCGLTSHDKHNRSAELSLYIAPEQQQKGYGEPTFKTLMRHGFRNLNLHSIWCECFTTNPVIKMVKNVGFRSDGTRRECYFRDGKYIDAEFFSILEGEWKE